MLVRDFCERLNEDPGFLDVLAILFFFVLVRLALDVQLAYLCALHVKLVCWIVRSCHVEVFQFWVVRFYFQMSLCH